jgi:hypothetical protein
MLGQKYTARRSRPPNAAFGQAEASHHTASKKRSSCIILKIQLLNFFAAKKIFCG